MSELYREVTIPCKNCNGTGNTQTESGRAGSCKLCAGTGRIPMKETGPQSTFGVIDEAFGKTERRIKLEDLSDLLSESLKNPDSVRGAIMAGIIAGLLISTLINLFNAPLLSFSKELFSGPPIVIFLGVTFIGGLVGGAVAGSLWALFSARPLMPCIKFGIIAGILAAIVGLVLIPVIRLNIESVLLRLLPALLILIAFMVFKWHSQKEQKVVDHNYGKQFEYSEPGLPVKEAILSGPRAQKTKRNDSTIRLILGATLLYAIVGALAFIGPPAFLIFPIENIDLNYAIGLGPKLMIAAVGAFVAILVGLPLTFFIGERSIKPGVIFVGTTLLLISLMLTILAGM